MILTMQSGKQELLQVIEVKRKSFSHRGWESWALQIWSATIHQSFIPKRDLRFMQKLIFLHLFLSEDSRHLSNAFSLRNSRATCSRPRKNFLRMWNLQPFLLKKHWKHSTVLSTILKHHRTSIIYNFMWQVISGNKFLNSSRIEKGTETVVSLRVKRIKIKHPLTRSKIRVRRKEIMKLI